MVEKVPILYVRFAAAFIDERVNATVTVIHGSLVAVKGISRQPPMILALEKLMSSSPRLSSPILCFSILQLFYF